jgi:hypothetical protein
MSHACLSILRLSPTVPSYIEQTSTFVDVEQRPTDVEVTPSSSATQARFINIHELEMPQSLNNCQQKWTC